MLIQLRSNFSNNQWPRKMAEKSWNLKFQNERAIKIIIFSWLNTIIKYYYVNNIKYYKYY